MVLDLCSRRCAGRRIECKKLFVKLYLDRLNAAIWQQRRAEQVRIYRKPRTDMRGMANAASSFVLSLLVAVDHHLHEKQYEEAHERQRQGPGEIASRVWRGAHFLCFVAKLRVLRNLPL